MHVFFPCGAGGNWLSHLIYCLQNKRDEAWSEIHYHNAPRITSYVLHDHGSYEKIRADRDIVIGGNCVYNFYVNFMIKWAFGDVNFHRYDFRIQIAKLTQFAYQSMMYYEFFQSMNPHLEWTLLYTDEDKFIDDLFACLDSKNVMFYPDRKIASIKIAEYKSKNTDPMLSYGNLESVIWQSWCMGYMEKNKIEFNYNAEGFDYYDLLVAQAERLEIEKNSQRYLFKQSK